MKKNLFILVCLLMAIFSSAQTATNFSCNDCSNVNHNLFSELNSGKVVVICWVMPCSSCISGALSAQTACNAFSSSNPGQVVYYVADDVANTPCSTISSWCATNGVNPTAKFSDASVNMSDYGAAGMPKIVVIGDLNHTVYYNQDGAAITSSGIQSAIANALTAVAAGVNEIKSTVFKNAYLMPNPAANNCTLSFNLCRDSKIKIEVFNGLGEKMLEAFNGNLQPGENKVNINTSDLPGGNYLVYITDGESSKKLKLIVAR